jgi:hypothetical protein
MVEPTFSPVGRWLQMCWSETPSSGAPREIEIPAALDVETELDHVAIAHDVIFSFDPQLADVARPGERA